ncbi:MAG: hypothetical protein Q8P83_02770 [bacterium]|nr:hypothetical protein [bacterium]
MPKTSLTSGARKPASKDQVRRVRTLSNEAIEAVLEGNSFEHDELQAVHTNGGEYKAQLAESFIAFLRPFARKVRGIVMPKRATETGLILWNWSVWVKDGVPQDFPEAEVVLSRIDYDYCPIWADESLIGLDTLLDRAGEVNAIGSLGLGAKLLKAQNEGEEIFPVESRGKIYVLPLTVLLDDRRVRRVAFFYWSSDGKQWVLEWYWGGRSGRIFRSDVRLLRVRE